MLQSIFLLDAAVYYLIEVIHNFFCYSVQSTFSLRGQILHRKSRVNGWKQNLLIVWNLLWLLAINFQVRIVLWLSILIQKLGRSKSALFRVNRIFFIKKMILKLFISRMNSIILNQIILTIKQHEKSISICNYVIRIIV